jgi:hypothetical protein
MLFLYLTYPTKLNANETIYNYSTFLIVLGNFL